LYSSVYSLDFNNLPLVLSRNQAAEFLSTTVATLAHNAQVAKGQDRIPFVKMGRKCLYDTTILKEWLANFPSNKLGENFTSDDFKKLAEDAYARTHHLHPRPSLTLLGNEQTANCGWIEPCRNVHYRNRAHPRCLTVLIFIVI
jgi:hypothetical protein